jgi:hypothetical protein
LGYAGALAAITINWQQLQEMATTEKHKKGRRCSKIIATEDLQVYYSFQNQFMLKFHLTLSIFVQCLRMSIFAYELLRNLIAPAGLVAS